MLFENTTGGDQGIKKSCYFFNFRFFYFPCSLGKSPFGSQAFMYDTQQYRFVYRNINRHFQSRIDISDSPHEFFSHKKSEYREDTWGSHCVYISTFIMGNFVK